MKTRNIVLIGTLGLVFLLMASYPVLAGCTCYQGATWCTDMNGKWYSTGQACTPAGSPGTQSCTCIGNNLFCKDNVGNYRNTGQSCGYSQGSTTGQGQCTCGNNGNEWCTDQYNTWRDTGQACWGTGGTTGYGYRTTGRRY